jgi:hypothetical protein
MVTGLRLLAGGEDHPESGLAGEHAVVGGLGVVEGAGFCHRADAGQRREVQGFLHLAGSAGGASAVAGTTTASE